jgi:hypothetical protein
LSRTFRVVVDLVQLRSLMRRAIDPSRQASRLYEIDRVLETRERIEA